MRFLLYISQEIGTYHGHAVNVLLELGLHNPLAAGIGRQGESEWALARRVLSQLPPLHPTRTRTRQTAIDEIRPLYIVAITA